MDPGLITLGALAIGATALLPRFAKTKKEGFEVIPTGGYPQVASQAQAIYNEFTLSSDPRTETNRVAQMSPSEQQSYQGAVNTALTSFNAVPNAQGTLQVTNATNKNPVYIPDQNALLQKIAYCESKPITENVFTDKKFAENCGVCLTGGKLNNQQTFKGKKGLYLSPNEREHILDEKTKKNLPFSVGKPTNGYCEGAGGIANAYTFALNKEELSAYEKRLQCQTNKSLTGDCATCLADGSYTYLGDKQIEYDTITFYVAGKGSLEVSIAGKQVELGPVLGDKKQMSLPLTTQPKTFQKIVKEGDILVFTVKSDSEEIPGEFYGCLEAPTTTGGVFQVALDKILLTDEINNSAPRKARDFPVLQTPNGQVYCSKLLTRYGKNTMILTGSLPFLFAGNSMFEGVDCKGSILQTKPSSVEKFGGDPCYKPASQKEGTWTDACLQNRIQNFGCTSDGDLYKNPSILRTMPMSNIIQYVQDVASKQFSDSKSSKTCNGKNISTPCDPYVNYNVNESPPISKECVRFLYYNEGAEKPGIGPTYTGPINTYYSLNSQGKRIYCLPGAKLDIDKNPALLTQYETIARKGYKGSLGLKAIQQYLNDNFRQATNTGLNANIADNKGGRADSIGNCFTSLAQIPDNVLPATNLPNGQFIKISFPRGRTDPIQISQLAAFDNRGQNVAFGKPVSAANKLANDCGPERAVDGKLQSRAHPFEYHSLGRSNDFWMVDLTREYPIKQIDYYNRADCCSQRAAGMIIELLDKNKKTVWQTALRGSLPKESFFTFAREYNI